MDERVRLLEDLANPVRYGVLTRLEKGPATASELAAALGVSPTQLANHLRRLRERGLVAASAAAAATRPTSWPSPACASCSRCSTSCATTGSATAAAVARRAPPARATTTSRAGSASRCSTP